MPTRWGTAVVAISLAHAITFAGCIGSRSGANDSLAGGAGGSDAGGAGPGPGGGPAGGSGGAADGGAGAGAMGGAGPVGPGGGGPGPGGMGPGQGGGPGGAGGDGGIGGAGGSGPVIDCTTDVCSGGEVCCFDDDDMMANFCALPGTCPASHVELSCQHPSDCPGAICCGIYDFFGGMTGYEEVRCDAACDPPQMDLDGIIMCGDDPSVCPGGAGDCLDSASLPEGFNYCDPN